MTAFDRAAAATFLNATLGDAEGFAALAFGHEGYFNERGRYSHKEWTETSYAWPSEGERLLDDVARELLSGQRVDVYVCPYVRATGQRKKGEAVSRRLIHADRDGTEPLGEDLLTELGVSAVDSGSPGHEHVYLSLADDLDPAPHELLCRALAAKVGQADPKFSDNDVLRLPGAWNFKHDPRGRSAGYGSRGSCGHPLRTWCRCSVSTWPRRHRRVATAGGRPRLPAASRRWKTRSGCRPGSGRPSTRTPVTARWTPSGSSPPAWTPA